MGSNHTYYIHPLSSCKTRKKKASETNESPMVLLGEITNVKIHPYFSVSLTVS